MSSNPFPHHSGPVPDAVRRQQATQATLEKYRAKAFSWKGATCAHLLRYHLRQMGHKPPVMPQFQSAIGAKSALRKMGVTDLAGLMRRLGLVEVPVSRLMLGDVAIVPGDNDVFDAIIIKAGSKYLGWHDDATGLAVMDLDSTTPGFEWRGAFSV